MDEMTKTKMRDRERYVEMVEEVEDEEGMEGMLLSKALRDEGRGGLVTAMRLFQDGKLGLYGKVVEEFLDGESWESETS
jgi:hypothetical protein